VTSLRVLWEFSLNRVRLLCLSLVCVCVCREGVGEAVPGDGEGQDRAAVRREAAPARQEEHQAQEEAFQDGMLLFLLSSADQIFVQVLKSYMRFSCELADTNYG